MCQQRKQIKQVDNTNKQIKKYRPLGKKGDLYSFFITYTDGTSEKVDITLESRTYEKIYQFHLAHEKSSKGISYSDIELFETLDD